MSDVTFDLTSLRQAYLDFMAKQGHVIVPSVSLVPENDPTTLFTSAGMQSMIPYFFTAKHPQGSRITNSQKCFRSEDIEEVGDNRHTTFFEMLGNWSFGDYFKKEQIQFCFSFLVDVLQLDPKRLYVSVFAGDQSLGIPRDDEAAKIWQQLFQAKGVEAKIIDSPQQGLQGGRIFFYGETKNWWSRSGVPAAMPVGEPGGPDSEVFYDFAEEPGVDQETIHRHSAWAKQACHINCDCGRFMEIGNSVFMQYQKTKTGFAPLAQANIDFGGGLERLLAAVHHQADVFLTPAFASIIQAISQLTTYKYQDPQAQAAYRIIADHLRASIMLIADGVIPANKAQGYVLRRLLRRALRQASLLEIDQSLLERILPVVIALYQDFYPKLTDQEEAILAVLLAEEKKFKQTLSRGLAQFKRLAQDKQLLTAQLAFKLYESYGFPFELSIEEAKVQGLVIEDNIETKISQARQQHAQQSRQASAGHFKGGLADHSQITTAFHTSTHLLQAALRQLLGDQVKQKGSHITDQRLRFDFTYDQALTADQVTQIEQQLATWLAADLSVSRLEMSKQAALKSGAIAFFPERYPDQVSVYLIGNPDQPVSKEICVGPHVEHTGQIAQFGQLKIVKQKAVATGVRRIYMQLVSAD